MDGHVFSNLVVAGVLARGGDRDRRAAQRALAGGGGRARAAPAAGAARGGDLHGDRPARFRVVGGRRRCRLRRRRAGATSPPLDHRSRLPARLRREELFGAARVGRVLRRRRARPSRPPPARNRHPGARRAAPDARRDAHRAAGRRLHQPDRDPARAARRRQRRLLRAPHRRRRVLRDVRADVDSGSAAADRADHGDGARSGAGVRRDGRDELGGLLPDRARRDLQAARARLHPGRARPRRLRLRR